MIFLLSHFFHCSKCVDGWMIFLLSLFLECNQLMGDFLIFHLLEYIGNLDVMCLFECN
jgi:hypothetical protein